MPTLRYNGNKIGGTVEDSLHVNFNNTNTNLEATNLQEAIEEIDNNINEVSSNLSTVDTTISNLGRQEIIGSGFSTNTQNPWPLSKSIKSYRYILVIINADWNIWTSVIPSARINNNMRFYYNCKGNNDYYVEGHFRFNSNTTITVEQTALVGWTGAPGQVEVYGIS